LWNAFKKLVKEYSSAEKDQLFYQTAAKVYRIID
jgi:predicted TIM-barrel fold metal-dependent hydrolase